MDVRKLTSFELINDYRALGYSSIGYRYSNLEMANIDNTAQEFQIDVYKGLFKYIHFPTNKS